MKVERSFSQGFSFLLGYNYNREASTEFFNSDDRYAHDLTWIGSDNPRHRLSSAGTFDFPLGKGRKYGSNMHPVLNAVIGGWSTSHLFLWNSGPFLRWGQLNVNGDPRVSNPTADQWFNTAAFSIATPYKSSACTQVCVAGILELRSCVGSGDGSDGAGGNCVEAIGLP